MNFIFTAFLLVLGGLLLMLGFNSTESVHNDLSHVVIAHYSDRTLWYIVGGSICCVLGLVGIFRSRRA